MMASVTYIELVVLLSAGIFLAISTKFGIEVLLLKLHKCGYVDIKIKNLQKSYENARVMWALFLVGSVFTWFVFYYVPTALIK